MKKAKMLAAVVATFGLVASPVFSENVFAGVTEDNRYQETTNSDTVDLTNEQRYLVSDDIAGYYIDRITNHSDDEHVDGNTYCDYLAAEYSDDEEEVLIYQGPLFCFEYDSENETLSLYADRLPEDYEDGEVLSFPGITVMMSFRTNQPELDDSIINVGDPDDINHAYENTILEVTRYNFDIYAGTGYAIIDGADQEHEIGSGNDLKVHATGSFENDFDHVEVDDEEVGDDDFVGEAGSTIITLKSAFLDTLSEGSHTLKIVYANGDVATTFVNVKGNPKTFDATRSLEIMLGSSLALIGFVAIRALIAKKR